MPARGPGLLRPVLAGLLLRCPRCGRGHVGQGLFGTRRACEVCGHAFAEGWGDYTGTMMIAQFLYGAIGLFSWFFLYGALTDEPAWKVVLWVVLFGAALPLLTYRNLRGAWLGMLEAGTQVFDRDARD